MEPEVYRRGEDLAATGAAEFIWCKENPSRAPCCEGSNSAFGSAAEVGWQGTPADLMALSAHGPRQHRPTDLTHQISVRSFVNVGPAAALFARFELIPVLVGNELAGFVIPRQPSGAEAPAAFKFSVTECLRMIDYRLPRVTPILQRNSTDLVNKK